jgi:hypothetical protein
MMIGMTISIMEILLLMMLLLYQQNCRLSHGPHHTSHPNFPCMMGTQIQSNFWWDTKQLYLRMGAIPQSWQSPSSWQSEVWHRHGTLLSGQGQSRHGRSLRTCWSPVFKGSRWSQSLLRPCFSVLKTMRSTFRHMSEGSCAWEHKHLWYPVKPSLRPWSKVFGQGLRPGSTAQYFARKPPQTLEKLLQKMDEYIRADNDFRQRREEAYRFSEMTRGFRGRVHPRYVRSIHSSSQNDDKGGQFQRPQHSSQSSGQQQSSFRPPASRGRGGKGFGGRYGDQPRKIYCLFCGEDKGHTTRTCQITIQKQKEIAKAEAQQNQP